MDFSANNLEIDYYTKLVTSLNSSLSSESDNNKSKNSKAKTANSWETTTSDSERDYGKKKKNCKIKLRTSVEVGFLDGFNRKERSTSRSSGQTESLCYDNKTSELDFISKRKLENISKKERFDESTDSETTSKKKKKKKIDIQQEEHSAYKTNAANENLEQTKEHKKKKKHLLTQINAKSKEHSTYESDVEENIEHTLQINKETDSSTLTKKKKKKSKHLTNEIDIDPQKNLIFKRQITDEDIEQTLHSEYGQVTDTESATSGSKKKKKKYLLNYTHKADIDDNNLEQSIKVNKKTNAPNVDERSHTESAISKKKKRKDIENHIDIKSEESSTYKTDDAEENLEQTFKINKKNNFPEFQQNIDAESTSTENQKKKKKQLTKQIDIKSEEYPYETDVADEYPEQTLQVNKKINSTEFLQETDAESAATKKQTRKHFQNQVDTKPEEYLTYKTDISDENLEQMLEVTEKMNSPKFRQGSDTESAVSAERKRKRKDITNQIDIELQEYPTYKTGVANENQEQTLKINKKSNFSEFKQETNAESEDKKKKKSKDISNQIGTEYVTDVNGKSPEGRSKVNKKLNFTEFEQKSDTESASMGKQKKKKKHLSHQIYAESEDYSSYKTDIADENLGKTLEVNKEMNSPEFGQGSYAESTTRKRNHLTHQMETQKNPMVEAASANENLEQTLEVNRKMNTPFGHEIDTDSKLVTAADESSLLLKQQMNDTEVLSNGEIYEKNDATDSDPGINSFSSDLNSGEDSSDIEGFLEKVSEEQAFKYEPYLEQLRHLFIIIDWEVPVVHTLEKSISTCPSKQTKEKIASSGVKVKSGPYSQKEDKIIQQNWKKFSEMYDFPEPDVFFSLKYRNTTLLPPQERLKFAQFIGRGLDDRLLSSIYMRFKTLLKNINKGKFTDFENRFILKYLRSPMGKDIHKFSKLALLLNRDRIALVKHSEVLLREQKGKIKWDLINMEKLLKSLINNTGVKKIKHLKNKKISTEVWKEVSADLNVSPKKVKFVWEVKLHPMLFIEENLELKTVICEIVKYLRENRIKDPVLINWNMLANKFPGTTAPWISRIYRRFIERYIPKKLLQQNRNLKDVASYAEKLLVKDTFQINKRFKKLNFKNGMLYEV